MCRRPQAGRCSPPHRAAAGCRSSAAAENAYFLTESGCESVGNIPTFSSGISCKKIFTTFCHQKAAPKVSAGHLRRDRTAVLTERAQKTALFCTPAPGARTAVRSDSSSGAMRNLRCAARNDDYLLVSVLAGLWPAGSHCEKSGKIPTLHCIPSGTTNPVILRRKSKPIPTQASPPASPRKQRRKRPCPIGFRHICPKTEK